MPLPLELFATDPVRFIPVQFRETDGTVLQPNARDALHLAPTALALQPSKPAQVANAGAGRDELDAGQFPQNLEVEHVRF